MFLPKKFLKKFFLASFCSCLAINAAIALSLALSPSVQAQSRRVRYVPPSDLDAPKTSASGITRSICQDGCLIALIPDLLTENKPIPRTISERPTLYFLTPPIAGSVKFTLSEDIPTLPQPDAENTFPESQKKQIYTKTFTLNNDAGIVALKIPNEAPSLEVGKIYTWKFTIIAKKNPLMSYLAENKTVQGKMQRVLPDQQLATKLQKISQPIERAALLANQGIWFETLQTLAETQLTVPSDPEALEELTALLKSASLDKVLPYALILQKQAL
ncbi:DUF928 domain-containing protein [Pseudanabaena sp. UWO310]|uniref:DUF928 domain-containing protein n=1 Tax=Pseudanabaena sp. UWO310 TaxID=2480795 RepID=UPI00115A47A9|nr:DUF928 domain-containing protein [Pseudanabaena sp. UWO310]TYQ30840.1 DUF928 domain-containing protein [Pseudanabaena sp. UWO310]